MKRLAVAIAALTAAAGVGWCSAVASTDPCRRVTAGEARYLVCTLPRDSYRISVGHNAPEGGSRQSVMDDVRRMVSEGRAPVLVMNGGMYHADLSPVGLLVEEGRVLSPLDQGQAAGNFYLKPNGVFWIDADGRAGVEETARFARSRRSVRYATQSGPLLVEDGRLHPALLPDGTSRHVRNGVGIGRDGEVVLVISMTRVSLGAFARLFRDELDCPDALYLDGSVSALADADGLRAGRDAPAGPVIRVERLASRAD